MSVNSKTKFFYGLGFISVGIKDVLYSIFVFFYFSQILGLDPIYTGSATLIAIMFDAISDPIIGSISDNFKSTKWGRRHPIMLMSAFPLGLSTYLLFLPPNGISEFDLFLWMTIFSILIRLFLTLFLVPGMSLGAELSSDYDERTVITSFRIMFTTLVSPFVCLFGLVFIFIPKEGMSTGLLNNEAKKIYKPYIYNKNNKLPFVTGKIAVSKDNYIYSAEWMLLQVFEFGEISGADIDINAWELNYPFVENGDSYTLGLEVTNNGNSTLIVEDQYTTNPDFQIENYLQDLTPGETQLVNSTYYADGGNAAGGYDIFTNDLDESHIVCELNGNIDGVNVGETAPDFELDIAANGTGTFQLSDHLGQIVVIAFFSPG